MIIFSYSETHSHLVTYFRVVSAHIFARVFYENITKVCSSRIGLESEKTKPFIMLLLEGSHEMKGLVGVIL